MSDNGYYDIEINEREDDVFAPSQIIKVIGVGGGGSNAVNYMSRIGISGVEFIVCNTDIQALRVSPIKNRIQIGKQITEGLGAGCRPERGKDAAIESIDEIRNFLDSTNTKVLFITAGMGGGTGTGAAPQIAKIAHDLGILTIGIVSIPFEFEGEKKMKQAMAGVDELEEYVDTISIIVNDRLLDENNSVPLSEAFAMADDVLAMAAKSIADVITMPGYINVDLRDVCTVMRNRGVALIGCGVAEGDNRAEVAVEKALYSPLLRDQDITGAAYVLIHIQYGEKEVLIEETGIITDYVLSKVGRLTNIIWGAGKSDELGDALKVSVVATGFNKNALREVRVASVKEKPRVMKVEPDFAVVPKQHDLELHIENSAEIENRARLQREARERRERLEQERMEQERKEKERIEKERMEKESSANKKDNSNDDNIDIDEEFPEDKRAGIDADNWFLSKFQIEKGEDFNLDEE